MRVCHAAVPVGLAITAADRIILLGAGLRLGLAGAGRVGPAAVGLGVIAAELTGATRVAREATASIRLLLALTLVVRRDASAVGHALVGVSLAIAAADRIVDLRASLRWRLAGAGEVGAATVCRGVEDADIASSTWHRAAGTAGLRLLLALTLVVDRGASGARGALVGVGLAVAAADRVVIAGASGRGLHAGA